MKIYKSITIAFILLIASCGSSESTAPVVVNKPEKKAISEKVWEEFDISAVGNNMKEMMFSMKNIRVKEGSWVRINLKNEGTDPAMVHNLLVINYGKRAELAQMAIEAGAEAQYIPDSKDVIAASELAQPGETITFEFQAPAKNNYEFFCSYPGHSQMMRGYFFCQVSLILRILLITLFYYY
jgi:azurin